MTRYFSKTLLLALILVSAGWMGSNLLQYEVKPDSSMRVEGTSTLHAWTCSVEAFTGTIEAAAGTSASMEEALQRVHIAVPASKLECKNGTMNEKAHEALQARKHATIHYTMTDATVQSVGGDGWTTLRAQGVLNIAGNERPITMTVKGQELKEGGYRFTGSTPLKMSTFKLDAPTAMFGTIKTGDEVTVHFDVVAR